MDVALTDSTSRTTDGGAELPLATYNDALDFLFARTSGGFKFGLERTAALLEHLGNPHRAYPTLHVAGTNGKGSSVATMAALLTAKGRRVATYTSPHLVDFRERMIVGGQAIPPADVIEFITRQLPVIERIEASFFEATTAMAFDFFARARAEIGVIEAGLGGRLDSTNVLDPVVAGVTSIGLDHTEYLGNTLDEIAGEKAGIFKPGRAAVVGERDPRIRDLLAERAHAAGASSIRIVADEVRLESVSVDDGGTTCEFEWKGRRATLRTPLAGRHQAANLAFSLVMLDAAGMSPEDSLDDAARYLDRVHIPGRFQHVGQFIFDVAHNPAGVEVLVQTLSAVAPPMPTAVVLCVLRDKDWREMIRALSRVSSNFVLTMAPTAPASRAWDLAEATEFARGLGLTASAIADFGSAIEYARGSAQTVLVTGSFHTVGDAMLLLQVSPLAG
ncbi:MAG TPA: folylpolyglutamate synthase/dihydrofolate synthase family protein [Gemmatimonadaceae bacterium]|nr:folylpolyglutamate synthase/dihydrofolate synthase family protein [Gemmatimonadaceae bacterium]